MIILVDFENTHASGLEGYTYLNENDTLVMYYSDENSAVTRGVVEDLKSNGVHVRLVKLLKQHSNALDMYIASTTGMYLDSGEKICIVSKDHGYAAVRDFWHSLRGAEILLGETIKECLLHSELNDEARIRLCKEREKKTTLVEAFTTMNTIPTQPTLSRGAQRRRRNDVRNFTEMSEPAVILPNPLVTETPADQLVRKLNAAASEEKAAAPEHAAAGREEKAGKEEPAVQMHGAGEREREHSRNGRRDHGNRRLQNAADDSSASAAEPVQERFGGYDGITKVNEASRIANARRQERTEQKAETARHPEAENDRKKPVREPETAKAAAESAQPKEMKALVPEKKKSTAVAKLDPNRVQFVWDPVTHSMKKVGGPAEEEIKDVKPAEPSEAVREAAEEKTSETAADHKAEEEIRTAKENAVKVEEEKKKADETPASSEVRKADAQTVSASDDAKAVTEEKEDVEKSETASEKSASHPSEEKTARKPRGRRTKKTREAKDTKDSKEVKEAKDPEKENVTAEGSAELPDMQEAAPKRRSGRKKSSPEASENEVKKRKPRAASAVPRRRSKKTASDSAPAAESETPAAE